MDIQLMSQAQANNSRLSQKYHELEILCPIELMLISKIIPFMFIVAQHKGAQENVFFFQLI